MHNFFALLHHQKRAEKPLPKYNNSIEECRRMEFFYCYISFAANKAFCSISADNLKLVALIFSNIGLIDGIIPNNFALTISPIFAKMIKQLASDIIVLRIGKVCKNFLGWIIKHRNAILPHNFDKRTL